MVVAILKVHRAFGLFMNWTGTQKGEGFEFHLLALAMLVFVIIRGAFSVDRALWRLSGSSDRDPVHA